MKESSSLRWILNNFKVLGVKAYPLNGVERLQIMYETFHQEEQQKFDFSYDRILQSGMTTKDFIAPTSLLFKSGKAIAITPCAAEHPMSFKVPGRLLTDGQCRMMINGIQFIQVLLEANGLAAGKDHQFKGRYDAEKNAVIISLEKDEQSALSPQKCTT